jgi:hypothetical protein
MRRRLIPKFRMEHPASIFRLLIVLNPKLAQFDLADVGNMKLPKRQSTSGRLYVSQPLKPRDEKSPPYNP